MLRVAALHDGRGEYYLSELGVDVVRRAVPERAPRTAPSTGSWAGRGAPALGLVGSVQAAELAAVLSGHHPHRAAALPGQGGTCRAYDLTFAAPKSASVLFGLGDGDVASAVVSAHESAVAGALGYVERRAAAVRRSGGTGPPVLEADGVLAAVFTHGTSRALDPHLHSHVVVVNRTRGVDGRWSCVDGRGLFAHGAAAGELYDAHLRHEMTARLGVEWEVRANGRFEIAGVGPMVIGAFSGRRAEIREALEGHRRSGRQAERVAWASTRDAKRATPTDVAGAWRTRADVLGLGAVEVEAVLGRSSGPDDGLDEHRLRAVLATGGVAPTRRTVVRAWSAALRRGEAAPEIDAAVDHWAHGSPGQTGVAEGRYPIMTLLPSSHLLAALGPRPAAAEAQPLWREAAAEISRYRARWHVTESQRALGVDPGGEGLSELPLPRLADHLATTHRLDESVRRLGRTPARQVVERSRGHDR